MDETLEIKFVDKPITPFGGLATIQRFYRNSGLEDLMAGLPLPNPGSNRGYPAKDLVEGFLVSVILGARRLTHSGLLRHDQVISKIFNWKKGMASESTFSRFFKKFDLKLNDEIFTRLNHHWLDKIQIDKHTVDIDSTVITRYGKQDGVEVGYNPQKKGRGSHHPLIAFSAEAKMVIQSWIRTGDSSSNTDFKEFLDVVLQTLPRTRIGLVRADSGFFSGEIIDYLESNDLHYIIASRMHPGLVQQIFDNKVWIPLRDGVDICTFEYGLVAWKTSRRFVVARKKQSLNPESGGKTLFPEYDQFSDYLYSAFVTDLDLSGELVWEIYRHRAEAETQIRELKENYGLDGFCCEDFAATEAAFRWVCVAYNLMALYKIALINTKHDPTLSTLKFQCIAIAGYLVRHSRKTQLVMSANDRRRAFFEQLFQKLEEITCQRKFLPKNRKFLMN